MSKAPTQIKYKGNIYKRADRRDVYLALYRVTASDGVKLGGKKYPPGTLIKVASLGLANTETDSIVAYKPGPEITVQHKDLKNVIVNMIRLQDTNDRY